ncbi:MAG: hypothetical protein IJ428_05790 [Clostridia bacterium]|nr:hypothetical protein [Clostridia bacterium]
MDFVKINGVSYDVLVTELTESFNILYTENTGRSIAPGGRMILDPIGTFYGHKVTFSRMIGHDEEFDALFEYVSQPRYDGIPVEIIHGQTTLSYEAYISNGERKLLRVDPNTGKAYWDAFSVSIIPMEAQVTV